MKYLSGKPVAALLIIFCLFVTSGYAQRPKVGLVLSGGGAKGISHVGILQAIDSAGLKIDYITGTSMGSIVGALYAIGYSGNQIEKIAYNLDWNTILSNKPNYRDISIEEKDEYGQYSVELGFKNMKPQIATGLIESEELWLKLNELFLPVYNIKNFSKFNIPFKCIATDLSNGKAVVLDQGEIVTALRSSMAIPSVFTAIEYDSTKLVDGGIIRNFPVTDVKEMGADIVIGVNLFLGLPDVSKLNNVLDVFYQITQYRDAEDLVKEKKLCNLIIEPPVQDYSAGSFGSVDEIMKIGKEMGKKYYPYFKHLADSLNNIEKVQFDPGNRLPDRESIVIDNITFEGLEKTSKHQLLDKIQIKNGKSYTAEEINRGFRKAYSTRYYDKVYYQLVPTSKGHATLHCIVKETAMTQLKAGLLYHSYLGPSLILNATVRNLLPDKSRTFVKLGIGENFIFRAEHNQAFGKKGNSSVNGSFEWENLPVNIYDNAEKVSAYHASLTTYDLNFSQIIGSTWKLSAGTNFLATNFHPDVADDLKIKGNTRKYFTYLQSTSQTTDRPFFPTRGHQLFAEAGIAFHRKADIEIYNQDGTTADISDLINGQAEYYQLIADFTNYHPLHPKWTLFYNLQAGIQLNPQNFLFESFHLGGIQKLNNKQIVFAGLNEMQINSASLSTVMLGCQYNFLGNFLLLGRANTGIYDFVTDKKIFDTEKIQWINGFSLGLGYNLGALPMEFNAMYSPETGKFYNHVRIGFLF